MTTTELAIGDLRPAAGVLLAGGLLWPLVDQHIEFGCPLRTLTGVPCPLCGMTTSVVATMHGDLATAIAANPAGILAVGGAAWLLLTRRGLLRLPRAVPPIALSCTWTFELFRFGFL